MATRVCSPRVKLSDFIFADSIQVVVAAKTISDPSKPIPVNPDPKSPDSTITTVTNEIIAAGGQATAIQVDVRYTENVENLIKQTISVRPHTLFVTH